MSYRQQRPKSARAWSGPPRIGKFVAKVTQPIFKKSGYSGGELATHWADIVGERLAKLSYPTKLSHARNPQISGGNLTVRVAGAVALEIEHTAPQIIERINRYFGYPAVGRLKIEQGPLPLPKRIEKKALRPLSDSEEKAVKEVASGVENPDLKARLEKLGRLVKQNEKK